MQARLAFSVAMATHPEVLLIDEVLAVGDEAFRERCIERLGSLVDEGGTILLVSHEMEGVRELCHRAIWMEDGLIRMEGPARAVVDAYLADAAESEPPEE